MQRTITLIDNTDAQNLVLPALPPMRICSLALPPFAPDAGGIAKATAAMRSTASPLRDRLALRRRRCPPPALVRHRMGAFDIPASIRLGMERAAPSGVTVAALRGP
jgi:hypothetical protein